ncbi:MAG: TlpA family protein disulfide reductase [Blastocatellia bacterium]|nr:TlpA family protein disulfide reductase [Blastocatellia bacterium]
MKKIFSLLLFVALSFVAVSVDMSTEAKTNQRTAQNKAASKKTQKAPDFTYLDLKGKKYTPSSLQGKVVIVNFWATWCGPCRKEIPSFVKAQQKYNDKLTILGISYDDEESAIHDFTKSGVGNTINYPLIFGSNQKSYFGEIGVFPTTIFIDKKGNIREQHIGYISQEELDKQLTPLLAE